MSVNSAMLTQEQIEFFWSKVDIKSGGKECWNWLGAKKPTGYGNVRINKVYCLAHRIAWMLCHFPIPKEYNVCHVCDNPSCCNPNHLMVGSNHTNMLDMLFKRRDGFKKNKAIGARNNMTKLTEEEVREIRNHYKGRRFNQVELAKKYGVTPNAIGAVVRFETWKHIGE